MTRPVDLIFLEAKRVESIATLTCAQPPFGCREPIAGEFRDALSAREYEISGLCQNCQDNVFGA